MASFFPPSNTKMSGFEKVVMKFSPSGKQKNTE